MNKPIEMCIKISEDGATGTYTECSVYERNGDALRKLESHEVVALLETSGVVQLGASLMEILLTRGGQLENPMTPEGGVN